MSRLVFCLTIYVICNLSDTCVSCYENVTSTSVEGAGLYAHNFLRGLHGVLPVKWNKTLAKGAESWARVLANKSKLMLSNYSEYFSENVYALRGTDEPQSAYMATYRWYSEIKNYPFDDHNITKENYPSSAFSALIWDDVKQLGIGVSHHTGTRESYVVARYSPKPNIGDFSAHVKPPLKFKKDKKIVIPPLEDLIKPTDPEAKKNLYL